MKASWHRRRRLGAPLLLRSTMRLNTRKLEAEAKEMEKADALRQGAEERGKRLKSNVPAHGDEWTSWIASCRRDLILRPRIIDWWIEPVRP
jgi:hypothetical protein